jgi:hypothetical protein
MNGAITNGIRSNTSPMILGVLLLASGLTLNYLFERHNIFKVGENSRYPISWADAFYPPICVFLAVTGIVLIVLAILRTTIQRLLLYVFAIAIPLTVLYTLFAFAMQFVATGADRLGECPGLEQAASSSNVIPESKSRPGHPAVGCAVERRGMFLSYYNDLGIYGVTDAAAQQLVLDGVAAHLRQAHTHPVQVRFYEKENWTVRKGKNGVTVGLRGPETLIRVVDLG